MSTRRQRLTNTCLGVATAGLLATGSALPSPEPAPPPAPAQAPTEEPAPTHTPTPGIQEAPEVQETPEGPQKPATPTQLKAPRPAFGAYLDYGPEGVLRIAEMQKWLGGTDLRVGHTYLPGDVWSNIEGAPGFLDDWAKWRKAREDRLFILNVPMLENNEGDVSDATVRAELGRGAQGEYDSHFATLAKRLVDLGAEDTVIVLGWEMNGATYTHRCGPDPTAWKTYWKRIVTTMRAVPGQKFRFDFAPNRGRDAIAWTECYPGDDLVDILGMDSYDQPPGETFDEQVNEPYGLRDHVKFAAEHGKVISYPEWGLFRNGDNPTYMSGMLKWIDEHKPLYSTVTDYCPHGVWQCDKNPKSSKIFRDMLYGRGTSPEAERPPVPPVVPDPTLPPQCGARNLGSWLESWLGKTVCAARHWSTFKR